VTSQVHLREFYELNSRSHEVYEWARGVDLPDGTTPHLLFKNLKPDVQVSLPLHVLFTTYTSFLSSRAMFPPTYRRETRAAPL